MFEGDKSPKFTPILDSEIRFFGVFDCSGGAWPKRAWPNQARGPFYGFLTIGNRFLGPKIVTIDTLLDIWEKNLNFSNFMIKIPTVKKGVAQLGHGSILWISNHRESISGAKNSHPRYPSCHITSYLKILYFFWIFPRSKKGVAQNQFFATRTNYGGT